MENHMGKTCLFYMEFIGANVLGLDDWNRFRALRVHFTIVLRAKMG